MMEDEKQKLKIGELQNKIRDLKDGIKMNKEEDIGIINMFGLLELV